MNGHAVKYALLLSLLIVLFAPWAWADSPKKYDAEKVSSMEIHVVHGEVRVMAWNGKQVTVESEKASFETTLDKGVLKVSADAKGTPINVGFLKIFAPENVKLNITTKAAKVDVQGFSSRVQVVTIDGDVRVSSCAAPIEVETATGGIEALDLKGDVTLKTVSGTIRGRNITSAFLETSSVDGTQRLSDVEARRLHARSHSGRIDIEDGVPQDGFWEVSTFDSNVSVGFAEGTSLDLEVHSKLGQVHVEGAIEQRERAGNYFRGRTDTGRTLVRLTSYNGTIDVDLD